MAGLSLISESVKFLVLASRCWKGSLYLLLLIGLVKENAFHALTKIFTSNRLCIAYLRKLLLLKVLLLVWGILLHQLQEVVLIIAEIEWTAISKTIRIDLVASDGSNHFEILFALSLLRCDSGLVLFGLRSVSLRKL